jgi:hypothetical protein
MIDGTVVIQYTTDWGHGDVDEDRRILAERLTDSVTYFGKSIKESFSDHEPALIDCAVLVSNFFYGRGISMPERNNSFPC